MEGLHLATKGTLLADIARPSDGMIIPSLRGFFIDIIFELFEADSLMRRTFEKWSKIWT